MMKRSGLLFLIAIVLSLLFILHHIDAVEQNDTKGVTKPTDLGNTTVNVEEEKKAESTQEETKNGTQKDESKEKPSEEQKKEEDKKDDKGGSGSGSNGELETETERKGDSLRAEECDPANRCSDDQSKFVACLRVPGKDSLDLSLLIQNKEIGALDVNIVTPEFVDIEQNPVQLKAKENKEVKFSVKDGGNNTVIVLKVGEGNCSLDFHYMIANSIKKSDTSALSGFLGHLSTRTLFILILAAALLIGLAWSCIRFRRMKIQEGCPRYQKIDMGLPVSTGGKKEASEVDGWDNSWEDDWDDEEAPITPSKPVLTPSSKGLASRRLNKDSRKD